MQIGVAERDPQLPGPGHRHAGHDDVNAPLLQGRYQFLPAHGIALHGPAELCAQSIGEIDLGTNDAAILFKNQRRVIRRDADSQRVLPGCRTSRHASQHGSQREAGHTGEGEGI